MTARASVHAVEHHSPLAREIAELLRAEVETAAARDALNAAQNRTLKAAKAAGDLRQALREKLSPGESLTVKTGPAECVTITRPTVAGPLTVQRSRIIA